MFEISEQKLKTMSSTQLKWLIEVGAQGLKTWPKSKKTNEIKSVIKTLKATLKARSNVAHKVLAELGVL